jgi:hypothetical protein
MQYGKPELPSNRKIMKKNFRVVDISQSESKRLTRAIHECMSVMNSFKTDDPGVSKLRIAFVPLYTMLREYAELSFQREFDVGLMFEVTVKEINFINGTTDISFVHSTAQLNTVYNITFRNHLYSEKEADNSTTNWKTTL